MPYTVRSMDVYDIPIEEIHPYENNPRHNESAVDIVARSMETFGVQIPLILDEENTIICGHTRLKAAQKLGLKTLPCVKVDDLPEEKIVALRLVDNKVAEASKWDTAALREELEGITGLDMAALFGITPPTQDEVLEEMEKLRDIVEKDEDEKNKKVRIVCENCGKEYEV